MSEAKSFRKVRYGSLEITYLPHLDGGGRVFGQDFVPVVKNMIGKVKRICEFGCGPGFIGFSLLANGLCDSLCLVDINPEAIEMCQKTIRENHLESKVSVYVSDGIKDIPRDEKWDLVVSNPPHFNGTTEEYSRDRLNFDPDWLIHEQFYKSISHHLSVKGSILFIENARGSNPIQWKTMIESSGLHFIKTFPDEISMRQFLIRYLRNLMISLKKLIHGKFEKHLLGSIFERSYRFYFVWSSLEA